MTSTQKKVNRKRKNIEVTNIDTNEVIVYASFTLAAQALDIPRSSLSGYFAKKRSNPFRNKYIFKLV